MPIRVLSVAPSPAGNTAWVHTGPRGAPASRRYEHVHPGVGVVGDGHVPPSHQRGGGPRALADLAGLLARATIVGLPPRHPRCSLRIRVEPIQGVVGDDEHPTRIVDRERVRDGLTFESQRADLSVLGVHRAHHTSGGDEPQQPVPVRKDGDDPVAEGNGPRQVVAADHLQARSERSPGRADHQDPAVVGGDHGTVVVVEVEVPATREVGEHRGANLPGRQREHRLGGQGMRVHQHQSRTLHPDADRQDPPLSVERHRCALGHVERRLNHHVPAERSGAGVRVGHVGIAVDVAAPVGRHERVLRHPRGPDRLRVCGSAEERLRRIRAGVLRDGDRRHRGGGDVSGQENHEQKRCGQRARRGKTTRGTRLAASTTHPR